MYFAEKDLSNPVLLCNKPDFLHMEEKESERIINCSAFFGSPNSIYWYKDNLYILTALTKGENVQKLIRISEDGSNRTEIVTFDQFITNVVMHKDMIYYVEKFYQLDGFYKYRIKQMELENQKNIKTVYEGELPDGNIQDMICQQDMLYFTEFCRNEEREAYRAMRLDLKTKQSERLFSEDDGGLPAYQITKTKLYFNLWNFGKEESENSDYYSCDLEGKGKEKLSLPEEKNCAFYADDNYWYYYDLPWKEDAKPKEDQKLTVFNFSGKQIASAPTGFSNNTTVIKGNTEYLFIKTQDEEDNIVYYAISKKDFNNKPEFQKIISVPIKKVNPILTFSAE